MKPSIESLYQTYFQPLYRVGYTYLRNQEDTEDLIQEIFLRVLKGRIRLDDVSNPEGYLKTAVRNLAIDRLRQDNTHEDASSNLKIVSEHPLPLEQQELGQEIDKAISALPNKTRLVFTLKQLEGKSYKEIATLLDISPNTVENHMAKALKLLRKSLAHHLIWVISQKLHFFSEWSSGF